VGNPVTLRWASSGGEDCVLATGVRTLTPTSCAGGRFRERYSKPGNYRARLTLTAAGGTTTARGVTVTVTAGEEGAGAKDEVSFTTRQEGLNVTFGATLAAAGATFSWDFGDGSSSSGARVTHRYARAGTYPVTLTVTGTNGEQRSTRRVTVEGERISLFDGGDLAAWELARGGAANWRLGKGFFEVAPGHRVGYNDVQTREEFGDFRLHLEFWVPRTPAGTTEQARGNSGVYLQGRYEVQILDSYGRTLSGKNDAGAIYEVADAARNASLPAETWQRYDIIFRAARFEAGRKVRDARVTLFWNGVQVHSETRVPGPTRLGAAEEAAATFTGALTGPILLQDHGGRVRYRNIWLEAL
jgi:PKD repeat protein